MTKELKTYYVDVPVVLALEVKSALEAADVLASVINLFSGKGSDPLLGANIATTHQISRGWWIARTRGAELNGRAVLRE